MAIRSGSTTLTPIAHAIQILPSRALSAPGKCPTVPTVLLRPCSRPKTDDLTT